MSLHSITVLGRDRPGIIADTTARLAALGLNLEDSVMTRLRGHFAMTLVCRGEATSAELQDALRLGPDLTVAVHELEDEPDESGAGSPWVLTVHGGDRPGLVSTVLEEVARVAGNVTDLSTRLAGDLYLLVAEIDLPTGVDAAALDAAVRSAAEGLGMRATLRPADTDEL